LFYFYEEKKTVKKMNDLLYGFMAVFMIHEFEEMIFLPAWLEKNKSELARRFHGLPGRLLNRIGGLSAPAFALAVFEEYLLLVLITISAVYFGFYLLWAGVFMAFSIHLVVHVVQWLVVRKYVPFIVSSILCLPYCAYVFKTLLGRMEADGRTWVLWTLAGIFLSVLNLAAAHKMAILFDKYRSRN
jgi:hypothetical protein